MSSVRLILECQMLTNFCPSVGCQVEKIGNAECRKIPLHGTYLYGKSYSSRRIWIAYKGFYSGKTYMIKYPKDLGSYSIWPIYRFPLGTLVWKGAKILLWLDQKWVVFKADRPHPRNYSKTRQIPWTDNDPSSAVRAHTDGRTDRRRDGRYQVHYLPALLKLCGR